MSASSHVFMGVRERIRTDDRGKPGISIVIPVYNEQDNIRCLWDELAPVLEDVDRPWEVIFVDDGSTDESRSRILEMMHLHPTAPHGGIRLIRFDKNLGQSAALWVGFGHVRYDVVTTMDADLQNDPRDIPCLLSALATADAVVGLRRPRRDPLARSISSRIGNRFCTLVTGALLRDTGSPLRVFKKDCLPALYFFKGLHRFIPVLFKISGYKVVETRVRHRPRIHGQSKYGIRGRIIPTLVDCFGIRWMMRRRNVSGEYVVEELE